MARLVVLLRVPRGRLTPRYLLAQGVWAGRFGVSAGSLSREKASLAVRYEVIVVEVCSRGRERKIQRIRQRV